MSKRTKGESRLDAQDAIIAKFKSMRPAENKRAAGDFEVARSTKSILSAINYVVRTGIEAYDDIVGGFPFGRICEVYGLDSSGKSSVVLRTAINMQRGEIYKIERSVENGTQFTRLEPGTYDIAVVYFDNEGSVDDDTKLTIEGTRADVVFSNVDTVDQMFGMIEGAIDVMVARGKETNRPWFLLIVVDTIAATSSTEEMVSAWADRDYPRQAAQISRGFRRLVREINRHNVCLICTNQVRENVKEAGMHRGPRSPVPSEIEYTTFGGRALRFYASHRVFMFRLMSKYKLIPDSQFAAGFLIGFRSVKNRIRSALREGRMALLVGEKTGGLHNLYSKLETLLYLGFAEPEAKEKMVNIKFKFHTNKVPMTTFGAKETTTTLAEDDEQPTGRRGGGRKDPSIYCRADWPDFYAAHKEDLDALWNAAMKYVQQIEGEVVVATDPEEASEVAEES